MKGRYINTKFWSDGYIVGLTSNEKLVYLYLIANPYTSCCGIYEIPFRTIANDTGIVEKELEDILGCFHKDGKIFYENGWIALKNFIKNQNTTSEDFMKGVKRDLINCPKNMVDFIYDRPPTVPPPCHTKLNLTKPNLTKPNGSNTLTAKEQPSFNALGYFIDTYLKYRKVKYIPSGGKDGKLLKTLLTQITEIEYKSLLDKFFISSEKFIVSSDYGVGVFNSQVNKLRAVVDSTIDPYDLPPVFDHEKFTIDGKQYTESMYKAIIKQEGIK
jgi:hypothetical protein